ncbi:MAG: hypothetical protein JNK05_30540 [Myxococcales bacterium]|nr:hypothetical protein [Myxococcales bacterium]
MSFAIRSIELAVAAMKASTPDAKLNTGTTGEYGNEKAWSFGAIKGWPKSPPVSTLYKQKNPLSYSAEVMKNPKKLVSYACFEAVGTHNAKGKGRWLAADDQWIIVEADLTQEQFDPDADEDFGGGQVSVVFALWRVTEGFAAAVWRRWDTATLATIMGFDAWPTDGWADVDVWYGE